MITKTIINGALGIITELAYALAIMLAAFALCVLVTL